MRSIIFPLILLQFDNEILCLATHLAILRLNRYKLIGRSEDKLAAVSDLTAALAEWQKLVSVKSGPASCVRDAVLLGDVDMGGGLSLSLSLSLSL